MDKFPCNLCHLRNDASSKQKRLNPRVEIKYICSFKKCSATLSHAPKICNDVVVRRLQPRSQGAFPVRSGKGGRESAQIADTLLTTEWLVKIGSTT